MAKNTFKLRSGNTPLFKSIGSSPYRKEGETDKELDAHEKEIHKNTKNTTVEGGNIKPGWQTAISALTSGLDAVYGTGKVKFSNPVTIAKEEEEEGNSIAQNIIDVKDKKKESGSYVKPGGEATGDMKDYPLLSEKRKTEYDARGWDYDDTIEGYNRDGSKKE